MKEMKKGFLFSIGFHFGLGVLVSVSKWLDKKIEQETDKNL